MANGHPILPAGFNSWDINGDEIDGPGVNEPIWPEFFDSFIAMEIIFITEEMLDFFADERPDIVFPCNDDTVVVPAGFRGKVFPAQVDRLVVAPEGTTVGISGGREAFIPEKPPAGAIIKRQSGSVPIKTRTVTVNIRRAR